MSNTMPPSGYTVPAPAGQPRPGTVTAASGLLYVLALVSLVSAALLVYSASFLGADKVQAIYERAGMSPDQAQQSASSEAVTVYLQATLPCLLAVLYIVLAVFVGKGKQWARITTWVIAG